jgi:hypothetical protein
MKLMHIFWSLVIVVAMIFLPVGLFLNRGKLNGGPEILGAFLVFWWLTDAATPAILAIALAKKRSLRHRFAFTLLAFLNLYFGLMGVFYFVRQENISELKVSFFFFVLNLAWSLIIAYFQLRPYKTDHSGA